MRLGRAALRNNADITLGGPKREPVVNVYLRYLRNPQKAGIIFITYAHLADGVWHAGGESTRGGILGRLFHRDIADPLSGQSGGVKPGNYAGGNRCLDRPIHGWVYSEEEIRDNHEYLIWNAAPAECGSGFIATIR